MTTDFEEKLCQRITELCVNPPNVPGGVKALREIDFQCRLAVECAFTGYSVACEKKKYTANYSETKSTYPPLNRSAVVPSKGTPASFQPAIDLFYEKNNGEEEYLLEIKFPRATKPPKPSDWQYLLGWEPSCISKGINDIFKDPFLEHPFPPTSLTTSYLTDGREGKMFTDFIRLLNLYESRPPKSPATSLYFCAFFNNNELCIKPKNRTITPGFPGFLDRMQALLTEYQCLPNGTILFTRGWGKEIDIWDYKPCTLSYFVPTSLPATKRFTEVSFPPPHFGLLAQGDKIFAFLIKITPPKPKPTSTTGVLADKLR